MPARAIPSPKLVTAGPRLWGKAQPRRPFDPLISGRRIPPVVLDAAVGST